MHLAQTLVQSAKYMKTEMYNTHIRFCCPQFYTSVKSNRHAPVDSNQERSETGPEFQGLLVLQVPSEQIFVLKTIRI